MQQQRIVTRDEWIAARKELLIKEKALTRAHDVACRRAAAASDGQGRRRAIRSTRRAGRARWPSSSTAAAS